MCRKSHEIEMDVSDHIHTHIHTCVEAQCHTHRYAHTKHAHAPLHTCPPPQSPSLALCSGPAHPLHTASRVAGRGAFPGDLTERGGKLHQLFFKADLAPVSLVICSRISAHRGAGPSLRSGPLTFSQEVSLSAPSTPSTQLRLFP